jgi:hypothetical protein
MSFKKIDPPKVSKKLGELTIEWVKLEGQDKPTVMLRNEASLPTALVIELLSTCLMAITEINQGLVADN